MRADGARSACKRRCRRARSSSSLTKADAGTGETRVLGFRHLREEGYCSLQPS